MAKLAGFADWRRAVKEQRVWYWPRAASRSCPMCALYDTHPKLRAAHVYRTVLATEHSG